ncbi:hypothetical protein V9T40_001547 [Parthenolecanium corni]|uniref:Cytochrome P450 n=1 Tax=Parthenolecanium corni TaxID=536013 RepID=A0AAN9TI66_9HEMI
MGDGLLASSGEKWKKNRAIMESAFATRESSRNFIQIFTEQSRVLIEEIRDTRLGVACSLWPLIVKAVIQTVLEKIILDFLLKNNMTDEEINDEIMTLIFAGIDTTVTALCFTLLMLAKNQDIQEKVYEEINTVFSGDKNKSAEFSELTKLTFLDQCIRESLRKLSVVPAVERRVTNDVVLSDGRVVPTGSNLILSIYAIHNNPQYYPDPQVWNPYNFDKDKVAQRPNHTFIPFATGLRQCLGYKFAMMSMKVFISTILQNFKLTTDQTEFQLDYYLIVRCRNGYQIKFEER